MTDKKLTNEEIKYSLEVIATTGNCDECKIRNCKWGTCNCSQITANAALDLINQQKSEIERLKSANDEKFRQWNMLAEKTKQHYANLYEEAKNILKTEAYKECLAKVRNYIKTHCNPYGKPTYDYDTSIAIMRYIDNLVKEMAGGEQ